MLQSVVIALETVPHAACEAFVLLKSQLRLLVKGLSGARDRVHGKIDVFAIHHFLALVLVDKGKIIGFSWYLRSSALNNHERTR